MTPESLERLQLAVLGWALDGGGMPQDVADALEATLGEEPAPVPVAPVAPVPTLNGAASHMAQMAHSGPGHKAVRADAFWDHARKVYVRRYGCLCGGDWESLQAACPHTSQALSSGGRVMCNDCRQVIAGFKMVRYSGPARAPEYDPSRDPVAAG